MSFSPFQREHPIVIQKWISAKLIKRPVTTHLVSTGPTRLELFRLFIRVVRDFPLNVVVHVNLPQQISTFIVKIIHAFVEILLIDAGRLWNDFGRSVRVSDSRAHG